MTTSPVAALSESLSRLRNPPMTDMTTIIMATQSITDEAANRGASFRNKYFVIILYLYIVGFS